MCQTQGLGPKCGPASHSVWPSGALGAFNKVRAAEFLNLMFDRQYYILHVMI